MTAYKCDLCGAYFDELPAGEMPVICENKQMFRQNRRAMQLCGECVSSLRRWMTARKADAFSEQYGSYYTEQGTEEGFIGTVGELIAEQPAIEAEPVRHGRWIPTEYDSYADGAHVWDKWECSECGYEHSGEEDTLTAFCPDCGARMEEKHE